ncbi:hypothetical protein NSTCB13_00788 [Nostoc sp. DSM 114160]|jgi:hypothetical protein
MNQTEYVSIAALNQYAYCPHRCCQRKVERIGGEQPRDETIFFAESPSS